MICVVRHAISADAPDISPAPLFICARLASKSPEPTIQVPLGFPPTHQPIFIHYRARSLQHVFHDLRQHTPSFTVASQTNNDMTIKRVAVIGAGPGGAIAVDALAQEQAFDVIRVFERREGPGGCW